MTDLTIQDQGPGPQERKLTSRLRFRILGNWPRSVVAERLAASGARRAKIDLATIESRCHTSVDDFDRYMRYVAPELGDMGVYDPALWQTALDNLKRSLSEAFESATKEGL